MSMHIGAPAIPTVKAGDIVKVGTKIAEADGYISSDIYSSVSGTVKGIEDYLLSNGRTAPAVVIESDGEMTVDESVKAPVINSKEELIDAVKKSGIVGLGGAGFPTFVKLNTDKTIEESIKEFSGMGYGAFKLAVGEVCADKLQPVRDEFARLMADKAYLEQVMAQGAEDAYKNARRTMSKVHRKIGFTEIKR